MALPFDVRDLLLDLFNAVDLETSFAHFDGCFFPKCAEVNMGLDFPSGFFCVVCFYLYRKQL